MSATEVEHVLYVQSPGSHLSLESGAVRCYTEDDASWRRLPLNRLESIILIGSIGVSTDLLLECAERRIGVHWLSPFGKPTATVLGPSSFSGTTRIAQYRAHADPAIRARVATELVVAKCTAMRALLRGAANDAAGHRRQAMRDAASRITSVLDQLHETGESGPSRQAVLGFEGAATKSYFTGFRQALRPDVGIDVPQTRTRRPATDPVNATLSFAYSLSNAAVQGAIHVAGLDPAVGFLHGDRGGQPSLVLDLSEEFRPAADRVVLTLFNRKQLRVEHFETAISGAVSLTEAGRKTLFNAWHEHRNALVRHRLLRREIPNAMRPHVQARIFVRLLAGETPSLTSDEG